MKPICEGCGIEYARGRAAHNATQAHRQWARLSRLTAEGFMPISGPLIHMFHPEREVFSERSIQRDDGPIRRVHYVTLSDAEDLLTDRIHGRTKELSSTRLLDATVRAVRRSAQAPWWLAMWESLQDVYPGGEWRLRQPAAPWWIPPESVFQRLAAEVDLAKRLAR